MSPHLTTSTQYRKDALLLFNVSIHMKKDRRLDFSWFRCPTGIYPPYPNTFFSEFLKCFLYSVIILLLFFILKGIIKTNLDKRILKLQKKENLRKQIKERKTKVTRKIRKKNNQKYIIFSGGG